MQRILSNSSLARTNGIFVSFRNVSATATLKRDKWKDREKQREFFEEIAQKLNINKWEDWYHISTYDIFM